MDLKKAMSGATFSHFSAEVEGIRTKKKAERLPEVWPRLSPLDEALSRTYPSRVHRLINGSQLQLP